ncbi:putative defense protein 3 [Amphiura filiformis]|uniref:putative defense protein 3 n=1 Tax=Amphiura filiformis TaxID=82378 RepID=UPI003B20E9F3
MDSRLVLAVLVFVVCHTSLVEGFSSGAPLSACVTMTPAHLYNSNASRPIDPEDGPSPYSLQVDKLMVRKGGNVQVTINGGSFQGFLLQARLADGSSTVPVGTFSTIVEETKITTCTAAADSVTHSSKTNKTDGMTVTWMAPNMEFGDIKFVATVAEKHCVFWVGHESSTVSYDPTEPTAEPEPTTQSAIWIVPSLSAMMSLLIAVFAIYY